MENPEEILHSLEEFAKMKPKDIPRELEEYLKFVAKTGDPVYQWPAIKSLFREKLISVITEFYESCTSMEIPPCPNVEIFNYDLMKTFILEKLDTFGSAPFTLQRICELLTSPRKEYTRIDKYMRALEKNILVVSTMEPCGRRTENGESIMNGVESDHETVPEPANEINVEEMDDFNAPSYVQSSNRVAEHISFDNATNGTHIEIENTVDTFSSEKATSEASTSSQEIVCVQYVSIEPVDETAQNLTDDSKESSVSLTITAINVKEQVEPHVQERDSILTEDSSHSADIIMENNTANINEVEEKVPLENEPIQPATTSEGPTHSEAISSTEVAEKPPEDSSQAEVCPINESQPDNATIAEDDSISSTEDTANKSIALEEMQDNLNAGLKVELLENSSSAPPDNVTNVVDSTTKTGDDNVEQVEKFGADDSQESTSLDLAKPCAEQSPEVESTEDDKKCDEEKSIESMPVEQLKVEETNEVSVELIAAKDLDESSKVEEVSSFSMGDEETRMEVDIADDSTSDVPVEQGKEAEPMEVTQNS